MIFFVDADSISLFWQVLILSLQRVMGLPAYDVHSTLIFALIMILVYCVMCLALELFWKMGTHTGRR